MLLDVGYQMVSSLSGKQVYSQLVPFSSSHCSKAAEHLVAATF